MKFLSQINVNTEYTLPFVDGANGQVLTTDGNGAVYWGSVSAGSTNLNALTDVVISSPSTGQLLRYGIPVGSEDPNPVWYNWSHNFLTTGSSIDALGDVTISTATAGQILQYNGTAWVNTTLSTVEYVSKVQHLVKAGVAITKGQAVYVTGSDGTNMIVGLASNTSEGTSSKVMGLAASTAAINGQIFVVTEGLLAGLNTSTATAGDPVWLGANGNLIFGLLAKPTSPLHLVYIGVVTRVQQNNGEIFVKVQNGIEIDEIHDVQISSPATGQLLRRDTDGYWKNWTPNFLTAEADTLNSVTGRGATTTNAITVGGLTVDTSTLVVDATNDRVGIGTTSPLATLDVVGHTYIRGGLLYVDTIAGYSAGAVSLAGSTNFIVPSGNIGIRTTTPQKFLDVNGSGIVASFGGSFSPGSFAGVHFGYSESHLNNDNYKKSAIVFERTDNHGQGGNASGKIHFLLNNIGSASATSLAHSVMVIDTNSTATQGSARVGIGTTSPNSTLDVNGAANATSFSSTALLITNADISGSLQPDQGDPANKIYSFRWGGNEQGYIDTDAKITFAGFKTPAGTSSQFLKANGTVDSNTYVTSTALNGYATQAWVNLNYYNRDQIDDFFSGAEEITGYNRSNWDAAYNDKINSASFNTTTGVLTLTQQDLGTVTVDLDGRYLTSDTDAQELTWDSGSKTLGITNGNDVILDLASEDFVTSQGYITSVNYLAIQTIGGDSGTFNLDTVSGQHGFVRFSTGTWGGTNPYPGNYSHVLSMNQSTVNGNRTVQMYMGDVPGALFWRMNQGGTLHPWERIWTAGNDGTGSGLDADLLDGQHGSYYAAASSLSSYLPLSGGTLSGNLTLSGYANPHITLTTTGGDYSYLELYDGSSYGYIIKNKTSSTSNGVLPGSLYLYTDSSKATQIVHNGTSNAAFLSGGDVYIRGQVYVGGNGASTGTQLVYNSGTWGISISGNADSATNLIGLGSIQSTSTGTSYQNNYQVRENSGGGGNTNEIYAPQLAFHWGGVVASSIMMEASGRIAIRNNPGTGYENFIASVIYSSGYGNSTQWNTAYGWGNHASAGYAPINAPSFTSNATLIGAHQSGYGMLRLESSDDMILSMDNTSSAGWNGIRFKNLNNDWAFFGKPSGEDNKIVIDFGFNSTNEFEFSSGGNLTVKGTITENSSIRYKENVKSIPNVSQKVEQLDAVSYNKIGSNQEEIGLIAEDVAELFPEVVKYDNEGRPDGVNYSRLSVILLKAVQELTERVNKLENK